MAVPRSAQAVARAQESAVARAALILPAGLRRLAARLRAERAGAARHRARPVYRHLQELATCPNPRAHPAISPS